MSRVGNKHIGHTLVERGRELERADELRVKTRCDFNAHAAAEKPDVHDSEIFFLPPSHVILLHHASDDGLGRSALRMFYETHDGGFEINEVKTGTARRACCELTCFIQLVSANMAHYPGSLPQTLRGMGWLRRRT